MLNSLVSMTGGALRRGSLPLLAALLAATPLAAQRPTRAPAPAAAPARGAAQRDTAPATAAAPPAPVGRLVGVLSDSIRVGPLAGATVLVGTTGRGALSDADGRFVVDSVPPGEHQVMVAHPMLDSLYISLTTPPVRILADSVTTLTMAIPSIATLMGSECSPATMRLGPAVFFGRVLDADTREPAPGVRVSLVWTQIDAGTDIGLRRMPRVRTATSDARGYYRICGIPSDMDDGSVLAERGRVKTAEVPIVLDGATLGMRSLLVRPAADSLATTGRATVMGKVVDTLGAAVPNAQVSMEGASVVATTNARGEFRLDSLPAGTQALVVRRVGFAPSQTIVDLASAEPMQVAVQLERAVPRLAPIQVTAQAEALSRVGFEDRQKRGMGRYLGPDDLARMQPQLVTSALRTLPGLRVVPSGTGGYTVQSSRDATGGCVSYWVDGAPFREMTPGDLDSTFPANQMAAIEVYQPGTVPGQFTSAGQSSCTTVVIWTQASVRRKK